jgi:adenylosuccinate synthase
MRELKEFFLILITVATHMLRHHLLQLVESTQEQEHHLERLMKSLGSRKPTPQELERGPFPTELFDAVGEEIQQRGKEFGATTGRKRRCGWIDLPLLRYSVKASHLTSICLTKLDVLSGIEELKVCTHYRYEGKELDCAYPGIALSKVEPVLKDVKPFDDDFSSNIFSENLNNYISMIEQAIKIPVGILAYGPDRKQISFRRNYFN